MFPCFQTIFSICSNSKLFAALSLAFLVEDPDVDLEWTTKIADILPDEWKLQDIVTQERANLLDILSHRTGLPAHDLGWTHGGTSAEIISGLRFLRPSLEFREGYARIISP